MSMDEAVQQMVNKGWKVVNPSSSPTPTPQAQAMQIRNQKISQPDPSNIEWLEQKVLPITRKEGVPDA